MTDSPEFVAMDFRQGSPCQQAASELMDPRSFGADESQDLLGGYAQLSRNMLPFGPTFPMESQAFLSDSAATAHQLQPLPPQSYQHSWAPSRHINSAPYPQHRQPQHQAGLRLPESHWLPLQHTPFQEQQPPYFQHRVSSAQGYSSCLQQNQTVPEQNCLAVMMKQAQDVGLWSKAGHQQSDKSSGLSLEPRHIAQTDVSPNNNVSDAHPARQAEDAQQDPIHFYQLEMDSLLPPIRESQNHTMPQSVQGLGHISRKHQLSKPGDPSQLYKEMPKLQPVSLGMTTESLTDILMQSQLRGMNDGPFRPPTRPVAHIKLEEPAQSEGRAASLMGPSEIQLSLGLAEDSPLDLHPWSYGDESMSTGATCVGSGPPDLAVERSNNASGAAGVSGPEAVQIRLQAKDPAHRSMELDGPQRTCKSLDIMEPRQRFDEVSRAECLRRYQAKKRRRHMYNQIRYHKRKVNADNRPRFKGRFVKSQDHSKSEEAGDGAGVSTLEDSDSQPEGEADKPEGEASHAHPSPLPPHSPSTLGSKITQPEPEATPA